MTFARSIPRLWRRSSCRRFLRAATIAVAAVLFAFGSMPAIADGTSFYVDSTADDGSVGTLRWAINGVNSAGPGSHVISIQLPSDSTITLGSDLPMLDNSVGPSPS